MLLGQRQKVLVSLHLLRQLIDDALELLDEAVPTLKLFRETVTTRLQLFDLDLSGFKRLDKIIACLLFHGKVLRKLFRLDVSLLQLVFRLVKFCLKFVNLALVLRLETVRNLLCVGLVHLF